MTQTAVFNKMFGFPESILNIFCPIHGKDRGQLFVCKFFRQIDRFHLTDEEPGSFRDGYTGQISDLCGTLPDNFRIQESIDDDRFADFFCLLRVEEIASAGGKLLFHCIVYLFQYDNRLFGSTDHSVVKGF